MIKNAMIRNTIIPCVVALLALSMSGSLEAATSKSKCLNGKLAILKSGGFSGPLLCDSKVSSFNLVGSIVEKNHKYLIYDYRYRFKPDDGNVLHGGQRVIVINAKGRYLGQYSLSPPPMLTVSVKGGGIAIGIGQDVKGTIEFKDGPPSSTFVDGERLTFFK